MALPLSTQWKLVAAGLMAHADDVMTGEECERLMFLVERDVDGDEYADWLGIVSDPDKLRALVQSLPELPASAHREVLEEAWLMAVVDGERDDSEVAMLEEIAQRLGVESVQLDFWREAWTAAQSDRAETTIRTLATLLELETDAAVLESVLHLLPTTHDHRSALRAIAAIPQARADVVRRIAALSKPLRLDVTQRVALGVAQLADPARAWADLRAIAGEAGLTDDEIALALKPA